MSRTGSRAADVRTAVAGAWRRSLVLRTVVTTLGLSLVVVGFVAGALLNRVGGGLLQAKQQRSLVEATAGWEQALQILAAADAGPAAAGPQRIVDALVADLARDAGDPARFEVLLLQSPQAPVTGPERATNLISPASIPAQLAAQVQQQGVQLWTSTSAVYLDGSQHPAMVVGAPVEVPGAGEYQLFHVFPYNDEQGIITLVRSATVIAGLLLVGLLAAVVWLVTRQVAIPLRRTAEVAERIAEGNLDERIAVNGEDEMARLGESFNDMASSLQEQITELEDLSRVQQRFVSDVSHELRTPLTTIAMASDLLHERSGLVDGDTRRSIELLATQVDRFQALLADLLEISRIDAGAAELDLEEVDLGELTSSVIGAAATLAQERGIEVRLLVQSGPPVVADRRRLSRIIRNLLTNALEYGAGSPVDVLVAYDTAGAAVGVRDFGPGLDDKEQQQVFQRFWRADPSRARTLGGSGLGLSIAWEDAALQHGVLEVASQAGMGSLFVLTLGYEGHRVPRTRPVPLSLAGFDAAMVRSGRPEADAQPVAEPPPVAEPLRGASGQAVSNRGAP